MKLAPKAIQILYDSLGLPCDSSVIKGERKTSDFIFIGSFNPLDTEAVEAITDHYVTFSHRFDSVNISSERVKREILNKKWLTYGAYKKLFLKHNEFTRMKRNSSLVLNDESRYKKMDMVSDFNPFDSVILAGHIKTLLAKHFNTIESPTLDNYITALLQTNLPVSQFLKKNIPLYIPETYRRLHTTVNAGSGGGKSELLKLFIRHYIYQNESSVVLIEPSSKLCREVAMMKEFSQNGKYADKLIYIDPLLDEAYTPIINPFDKSDKSEKNISAVSQNITKSFEQLLKGTEFTLQMEVLLDGCISTLLRLEKTPSIFDLQCFMNDDESLIEEGRKSPNKGHRQLFEQRFKDKKSYSITKSSIFTKLQYLAGKPTFARFIEGKNTIDLKKALEEKKVIIFNLSSSELGESVSSAIGCLMIATIQSIAHQRTQNFNKNTPIHLFIDECQNYVSSAIKKTVTESRKFNLFLTLSSQVLGQEMPKPLADLVKENTELKFRGKGNDEPYNTLKPGEFFLNTKKRGMVKFKVDSSLIDNKHSMSNQEWEITKKIQLERYYIPIKQETPFHQSTEQQKEQPDRQENPIPKETIKKHLTHKKEIPDFL